MNAAAAWLRQPDVQLALAIWCGVGVVFGTLLGWWRNRAWLGALAGLVLGPIGWWLTWMLPGRFRECPGCQRPLRVQATRCGRCGADVLAVDARSSRSSLKGSVTGARRPW